MGTTLANLHVFNGDEQQFRTMLPTASVGRWADYFVSAFSQEFTPVVSDKTARALSKKLMQPLLYAWIFDSDAVGFIVYQSGRIVAEHIMNPDGYAKMGNIALFCETLGLPAEDIARLRVVWKKGDAEEQLELTASLLGAPLYHDSEILPDKQYSRDHMIVDKWISERPDPPKIKSKTKAVIIQEINCFRWYYSHGSTRYCSVEPYDKDHTFSKCQFWIPISDGTISPGWSTEKYLHYYSSQDRIIGTVGDYIHYDSAEVLPIGYKSKNTSFQYFLSDGGFFGHHNEKNDDNTISVFTRLAPNGSEMWKIERKYPGDAIFACENNEIILSCETDKTYWLEQIDDQTGATVSIVPRPFGLNSWSKAYHKGFWWVSHDGIFFKDGAWENQGHALVKLDGKLKPLAELQLPLYTQGFYFSSDDTLIYVFFYKNQVMVVNTESLLIENVLTDKSYLGPLGFDAAGHFWLQRDNSTIEAWDVMLTKTLSRHKLRGEIMGCHKSSQGELCVVAWHEKEKILRIYKVESV